MSNNDLSTKSLSGFQKRLRLLMAEAHIKSNRALARSISEKGLFGETTEDSVIKAVQLHLRPAEKNVEGLPPSLSLKQALGYCSLFECSMDYLLGRTPIKSQDYNVRLICEWLRIPEETVVKIEKMTNHKTFFGPNYGLWCDDAAQAINELITHPRFGEVLNAFFELIKNMKEYTKENRVERLKAEIGAERLDAAYENDSLNSAGELTRELSEQEVQDLYAYREAESRDYGDYTHLQADNKMFKYQLIETIMSILNQDYTIR